MEKGAQRRDVAIERAGLYAGSVALDEPTAHDVAVYGGPIERSLAGKEILAQRSEHAPVDFDGLGAVIARSHVRQELLLDVFYHSCRLSCFCSAKIGGFS